MSKERLVVFLYLLLRDELPVGSVAGIVREILNDDFDVPIDFTSKYLEGCAKDLAEFLTGKDDVVKYNSLG